MDLTFKNETFNQLLSEISTNVDLRCNICKEEILVDSFDLSCNHKFHANCLLNSFDRYFEPKCPLCSISINFNHHKSECIIENCSKISYNSESLCNTHSKKYLKTILNQKNKELKIKNQNIKKIKNKIEKLKQKQSDIQNEIYELENKILDLNN